MLTPPCPGLYVLHVRVGVPAGSPAPDGVQAMTVAKVIEITASSPKSVEDAVRSGLKKVS
ncbi:dodecin domain-containing protein, partial [Enterobacter hormaechei]|uniref:dodecin domain-containing protein n=1 Tax=Enterobacter hormaechei TaxID=158836 RepID=UPI0035A3D2FE